MGSTRILVSFEGSTQQEVFQKIREYLDQTGTNPSTPTSVGEEFPLDVKKLYPKFYRNKFSAAMLTIILGHSKSDPIDVYDLAEQMLKKYPATLKEAGYTKYEEVTTGTVLAGNFLREKKLIDFEKKSVAPDEWPRRVYWHQ